MENASKALIIAGGALILVLLFTLMNYVFTNMGEQASTFYEEMSETEITEFNQRFLNYDGRGTTVDNEGNYINPLNIQDVVTIANLAIDNNKSKTRQVIVDVTLTANSSTVNLSSDSIDTDFLNNLLVQYSDAKFSCIVNYAEDSLLVGSVKLTLL